MKRMRDGKKKRFLENWKSFIVNLDDFQVDS